MRRTTKTVLLHVSMAGAAAAGCAAWRWQLGWGATAAERRRTLPGDDLISTPCLQATRAVGISAPPREVWPWLVQIGQDKAGFYSYDWLQRAAGLGVRNSDRVEPEWQGLRVGDTVELADDCALGVAALEDARALVLSSRGGAAPGGALTDFDFSWAFALEPEGPTGTRLVARERYAWTRWRAGLAVKAVSWVSFVMTRAMLAGLRDRAEGSWRDQVADRLDDAAGLGAAGAAEAPGAGSAVDGIVPGQASPGGQKT
ncbi:MAG: hypothetical protein LBD90_06655 [Bifidobacteriaceae bacterium]|jgi:hypothetical protein|nr:hypothetical protein [Bifidobacteriaceae bacterium]